MVRPKYAEQLLLPEWLEKRREVLERDNSTCQMCGATHKPLNAHHKRYDYGKWAWEYPMSNFITLFIDCHADTHDLEDGELHYSSDGPLIHFFVRQLESGMWIVYRKVVKSKHRTIVGECPSKALAYEEREKLKRQEYRKHKEASQESENIYRIRGY